VKRLAFWLPPLAWMAMIAWFSTAEFSAENTGAALGPVFHWLLPGLSDPQLAALHALTRKAAHVTEYAVLAGLWFVALTRERGLSRRRAAWVACLVAVGWACLDELHQATVPSRTASAMDVVLDSTGALVAAVVGRHGGARVLDAAALALLWTAAAGGVLLIAIDLASGVSAGVLWVTVPAAMLALALRRRLPLGR
jgi:VanZ family protein